MNTISFTFPKDVFSALRMSPQEFAQEMRVAAAVQWYAQGIVSQGKAAEIAGLSRAAFIDQLHARRIPVVQVSLEEIREEISRV